ncbi:response regulator transcription factor [Achromobacter sp. Marseille-Q0513]|uniref:response regulator transcription factor n=1 Tax=Achromobacter sp. Marseille-Q0513 TaxID=2829161 RepID=UPI001B8EDC66|nr:response regulator transcription factor [Achromobacter sp. Marseille-Q0513]
MGHEHQQADQLARLLAQQGFRVGVFDAWPERASAGGVDLIVLDLGQATTGEGVDLVARIRSQVRNMPPILAVTGELSESELAGLYDAGADDVMFKPLRIAVFAARVQALARRVYPSQELQTDVLKVGAYVIDVAARRLHLDAQPIKLSSREFDLALYLFRNVGRLVSRATLEKAIWGRELGVDSKTVDTHIYRLRVKLRLQPENGLQLASVYAQGFRLIQVVTLS